MTFNELDTCWGCLWQQR